MKKMYEAQALQVAMEDLKAGRIVDGNAAMDAVRSKYGL